MIKRVLRPRSILPMGFAIGLLVLWELGTLPVPFEPDAGPIARAAIAVSLAVLGAVIGFAIQLLVTRLVSSTKRTAGTKGDG